MPKMQKTDEEPARTSITETSLSRSNLVAIKQLEGNAATMTTGVICALTVMLDLKDLRTGLHATRLAEWAVRVGEQLGIQDAELQDLETASLLHDIGKIGVPDAILLKPGKLTDEETALARKHPEYGWAILQSIPGFERASLLVLHHHERYDGNGYPAGLESDEIPLGARIVAVVDAYDAMTSDRAYRKGLERDEAFRRLEADSGSQFDPEVTALYIRMLKDVRVAPEDQSDRHPLLEPGGDPGAPPPLPSLTGGE